jgi:hypothetical protein
VASEAQGGTDEIGMVGRVTITVGEAAEILAISRTSAYLCARRRSPISPPILTLSDRYPVPESEIALVRLTSGQQRRSTGDEIAIDVRGVASYVPCGQEFVATDVTYIATSS